jgi:hypothetical protein
MKLGSKATTQKPNNSRPKGKIPSHPGQKKKKKQVKSMFIVLFDKDVIVHKEFVPQGQRVNQNFYIEVMRRFREDVRTKRPALWAFNGWLIHHDNAPAHTALLRSSPTLPTTQIWPPATSSFSRKSK